MDRYILGDRTLDSYRGGRSGLESLNSRRDGKGPYLEGLHRLSDGKNKEVSGTGTTGVRTLFRVTNPLSHLGSCHVDGIPFHRSDKRSVQG